MNLSNISPTRRLGWLLRLPLRLVPPKASVPILQGPIRGMRWTVGSFNHGCWLGTYEHDKQLVVRDLVKPGSVVYDIGAHVGFYTLLFSRLVGVKGLVVAFEPLPRNLLFLRKHVRNNRLQNVRIFESAVSSHSDEERFDEGPSSSMGHLDEGGTLVVPCVRLDDLFPETLPAPDYLKIDVEGAEAGVLRGASRLLREARPTIFLATHGERVHAECVEILSGHGYQVRTIGGAPDELLAEHA